MHEKPIILDDPYGRVAINSQFDKTIENRKKQSKCTINIISRSCLKQ